LFGFEVGADEVAATFGSARKVAVLAVGLPVALVVALVIGVALALLAGPIYVLVGIVLGLVVIVSAFVLVGIYVQRANGRFDDLTRDLQKDIA
jgi:uncharacterized membrane protein (DUF485 family)